jgi:CysZ protein
MVCARGAIFTVTMNPVLSALLAALKSLLQPRMLALMIWPMLLAVLLWGGVSFIFWDDWVGGLSRLMEGTDAQAWIERFGWSWLIGYGVVFVLILLLLPAVFVTALLIAAVFAMPLMVRFVAERHYPGLEMKKGGTFVGSLWNAFAALTVYLVLWLLLLPLWLFGPLAVVIPVLLNAYINQRLFRYDALADHASKEEMDRLIERETVPMYVLGGVLGLIQFIPVLNFFAPIYIGLAFIHFCLDRLAASRAHATAASS